MAEKVCRNFQSAEGCWKGDKCSFAHLVKEEAPPSRQTAVKSGAKKTTPSKPTSHSKPEAEARRTEAPATPQKKTEKKTVKKDAGGAEAGKEVSRDASNASDKSEPKKMVVVKKSDKKSDKEEKSNGKAAAKTHDKAPEKTPVKDVTTAAKKKDTRGTDAAKSSPKSNVTAAGSKGKEEGSGTKPESTKKNKKQGAPPKPTQEPKPYDTFAFMGNATFMRAQAATSGSQAKFGVAGICWDGSTTNRPGSRFGPDGIRRASAMLCDGIHPVFNVSPITELADYGNLMLANTSLERMRDDLMPLAKKLVSAHSQMLWLGGDHSITLPLLRAYKEVTGKPLAVLHFDAHCDTWTDHYGEPSGHGTWVSEAISQGLCVKECFFQVGIRSAGERAARDYVKTQGGMIFTARELRGLENRTQLAGMLDMIRARMKKHGNPDIYLSLDIDCLDPAFAPGTGTPEPGGLTTHQVLTILEELVPNLPFVGMDCVEVAPPYDHSELTSMAATHFLWTYASAIMSKAGEKKKKKSF